MSGLATPSPPHKCEGHEHLVHSFKGRYKTVNAAVYWTEIELALYRDTSMGARLCLVLR